MSSLARALSLSRYVCACVYVCAYVSRKCSNDDFSIGGHIEYFVCRRMCTAVQTANFCIFQLQNYGRPNKMATRAQTFLIFSWLFVLWALVFICWEWLLLPVLSASGTADAFASTVARALLFVCCSKNIRKISKIVRSHRIYLFAKRKFWPKFQKNYKFCLLCCERRIEKWVCACVWIFLLLSFIWIRLTVRRIQFSTSCLYAGTNGLGKIWKLIFHWNTHLIGHQISTLEIVFRWPIPCAVFPSASRMCVWSGICNRWKRI